MLILDEVSDGEAFRQLETDWRRLFRETADATPFQSWEWLSSWWHHHGRGRLWILTARDGNDLVGLMPLTLTSYAGTSLKRVRWMGAPLSDYQQLIGRADRQQECARAFLAHLHARRDAWDVCDLNDQRDGSPFLAVAAGARVETAFHRKCPVVPLTDTWESFLARMKRKLRSNVTRRMRLARAAHEVELDTVTEEAVLPDAMNDLFDLHNWRWRRRGILGAFTGGRIQRFHHEVSLRFLAQGWLRLHRLRFDGRTVASFYCFHYGARVYYYLGGFDVRHGRLGPGQLLMAYTIERAIADGARELDLLRGDEGYKYEWGAIDRATSRLVFGHDSLRSRMASQMHGWERYWETKGLAWQRRLWGSAGAEGARPGKDASQRGQDEQRGAEAAHLAEIGQEAEAAQRPVVRDQQRAVADHGGQRA
jgi:CelD/BcsL family acetyltransferase involved in cellulose biosynthesis